MAQTEPIDAYLGPARTGLAIGATLYQLDGSTVHAAFATTGWYEAPASSGAWHHAGLSLPDAGGVVAVGISGTEYMRVAVGAARPLATDYTATRAAKLDNLDAAVTTLATQTSVNTLASYVDTEVAAIKAKTDNLPASPAATGDIPDVAAIATAVWANATRSLTTFGSLASDVWAVATRTITGGTVTTNSDKEGYSLSTAGVQAIWDALTSALTTVGSIGKLFVDNINATIGSRSSHTAANVRTEMDSNSTQLAKLGTPAGASVSADVAAIKADTANIGTAGAGLTSVASAVNLATLTAYVDTEVAAIKAKTDNLPAAPAATGDIPTVSAIDTQLSTTHGAGSWVDTGGGGATAAQVWSYATRTLTALGSPAGTEFTYTVTNTTTTLPIADVSVWFGTDSAVSNVVWYGSTDAFGIARDANGNKPRLDPGTYYILCRKTGFSFAIDTETVS